MEEYKFFRPKAFGSQKKFDKRLNEVCRQGWKPIALGGAGGNIILLQKVDKNNY